MSPSATCAVRRGTIWSRWKRQRTSEDELQRAEKELDKITHAQEAGIDQALESKEQELLQD